MHTLSLSRSSCFWLTSPCSPKAKQPQNREKQKNTQTNGKFMTSQTSVDRSGRGQRIKRKTPNEVKRVSFQVLWSHLVAVQTSSLHVFCYDQGECYFVKLFSSISSSVVLDAACYSCVAYLLALICS